MFLKEKTQYISAFQILNKGDKEQLRCASTQKKKKDLWSKEFSLFFLTRRERSRAQSHPSGLRHMGDGAVVSNLSLACSDSDFVNSFGLKACLKSDSNLGYGSYLDSILLSLGFPWGVPPLGSGSPVGAPSRPSVPFALSPLRPVALSPLRPFAPGPPLAGALFPPGVSRWALV